MESYETDNLLRQIKWNLDGIYKILLFMFFLLIIIAVLLIIKVCIKLYKLHTSSLRERYRLNAAYCIQTGGDGAAAQPVATA